MRTLNVYSYLTIGYFSRLGGGAEGGAQREVGNWVRKNLGRFFWPLNVFGVLGAGHLIKLKRLI